MTLLPADTKVKEHCAITLSGFVLAAAAAVPAGHVREKASVVADVVPAGYVRERVNAVAAAVCAGRVREK